jgi:hypothetical protein
MNEDYFGPSPERQELTKEQARDAMEKIRLALRQGAGKPLPSIPSLVKKARHAAKNAASPKVKIGYLAHAIKRLEFHRDKVLALYASNVSTSTDIDDLEYLSTYIAEANEAIRGLALVIERMQLDLEAHEDTEATALAQTSSKGKGLPSRPTTNTRPSSSAVAKETVDPVPEGFIDKQQAAAHLGFSLRTLGNKMKEPDFPIHRHNGRRPLFKRSELDAYAEQHRSGITPGSSSTTPSTAPFIDKTTVIAYMASLLAKAGHLDVTGAARLSAWAASGCNTLPPGERIDWLRGRKTLCAFIVCAQHASLLSIEIATKKSGKIGPLYEKAITAAFLDKGNTIKPGIDRTIIGPEQATARFIEIMAEFTSDRLHDPDYEDTFFGSVEEYFTYRDKPAFIPFRNRLEEKFELERLESSKTTVAKESPKNRRTMVFAEIDVGILRLFWDLAKEHRELFE